MERRQFCCSRCSHDDGRIIARAIRTLSNLITNRKSSVVGDDKRLIGQMGRKRTVVDSDSKQSWTTIGYLY